jgi:hypothetical protein
MANKQAQASEWIYSRILVYCHDRTRGIGGYYQQFEYKRDFFRIFRDAYYLHLCGGRAEHELEKRVTKLKKKLIARSTYIVSGDSIIERATKDFLAPSPDLKEGEMVSTLTTWWDCWTYAWDWYPSKLPHRQWRMGKIEARFEKWLSSEPKLRATSLDEFNP